MLSKQSTDLKSPPFSTLNLGIVTPMANERHSARLFVEQVLAQAAKYPFQKITIYTVFDNVCTDGTRELLETFSLKEPRLNVVFAPENRCVVDAYLRGYKTALADGCDWILEMDAGFSHNPENIPQFFQKMRGNTAVVYATRFTLGGQILQSSFRRKCISRFGGLISNLLLGVSLGDMTSGFILYSRTALEHVLAQGVLSKGPFFQTEMKYHARRLPCAEVPINYTGASHNVGKKALDDAKLNLRRLVKDRWIKSHLPLNPAAKPACL